MEKNVKEFIKKKIPYEMQKIYLQEYKNYKNKYEILYKIPFTLLNSKQLLKIKIHHFLKVIEFLEINSNEPYYFWLVKLYFCLPINKNWNYGNSNIKKNILLYKNKIRCKLRPTICYIKFLLDFFRNNETEKIKMKNICINIQKNFFHFFLNPDNQKIIFYDIKSKYLEFLKKTRCIENEDFGRLNYFTYLKKRKKDKDDDLNLQKDNNKIKNNNFIIDKFQIYKNEQKYLKFKFKSLLNKKTVLKNENDIFFVKKKIFGKKNIIKKEMLNNHPFKSKIKEKSVKKLKKSLFSRKGSLIILTKDIIKLSDKKKLRSTKVLRKNNISISDRVHKINKEFFFQKKNIINVSLKNDREMNFIEKNKIFQKIRKKKNFFRQQDRLNLIKKRIKNEDIKNIKIKNNFFKETTLNIPELKLFKKKNLNKTDFLYKNIWPNLCKFSYRNLDLENKNEKENKKSSKFLKEQKLKMLSLLPQTGDKLLSFKPSKKKKKKKKKSK